MFLRGLATLIALGLMTLQGKAVTTQHCQTLDAHLRIRMRGGGFDEDSIFVNGRSHSMYLCMRDVEYTNGKVNAESLTYDIIGDSGQGWAVYEIDEEEGVNIGDVDCNTIYGGDVDGYCNRGSCLRILQTAKYPGYLEVEVHFSGVPGNNFMHFPHLTIYWNYGCCGWDLWHGSCTNTPYQSSRWVAVVYAEECTAVCGYNNIRPGGYPAIESPTTNSYGVIDSIGYGDMYEGFRWTPHATDHCTQAEWKYYDTTVACLVDDS